MRMFLMKVALLISVLGCALLYGMEMAKDNMAEMKGIKDTETSILNFDIPGLTSNDKSEGHVEATSTPKEKQNVKADTKNNSIQARAERLDKVHDFNPVASLGEKIGDGISGVFKSGISGCAKLFNNIVTNLL